MSNQELSAKWEKWARDTKIWPRPSESFACPHYDECNASLQEKDLHLDRGKTCFMSYVGPSYGEVAPRLLLVGIDPGADYEDPECQKTILDWYYGSELGHQDYRGVVRTAAAILEPACKHCHEHCWRESRCMGDKRPDGECALRLFARANLVKCFPAENESRTSQATPVMFRNCPQLLLSEIEVLKPDLVVFHGQPAEWAFPNAMEARGYKQTPVSDNPKTHHGNAMVQEVYGPDGKRRFHVLYLLHTSRHWLDRQWDLEKVVEPALDLLRKKGVIPSV